ncbi:MAG: nucleotide sugar dehydrogenase [Streptomycetaceae bacterium]|nr:MAG: nucleotide sugar dehydrogenase [Streptomycetaceae bacterium]
MRRKQPRRLQKDKVTSVSKREKTVAIIGQGYVGLPLAMAAIEAGWSVIGVENSKAKYEGIAAGVSPVEDVSSQLMQAGMTSGKYRITNNVSDVAEASIVVICVPTPLDDQRGPDLAILESAVKGIAPHLLSGTLVISESTSYPGTVRDVVAPLIEQLKSSADVHVDVAVAPERVNPGDAKYHQKNTPRLVGGLDAVSTRRAVDFYNTICDEVVEVSQPEVAETAKLLENTFRLVNIALVNQLAQLCADENINVHEVIDAANTKPYGYMKFTPSVGVGGHCIPVDPMYLSWWAEKNGSKASIIDVSDEINLGMPIYVSKRVRELIPAGAKTKRVLIMGVAYKPGVSDVRETPATALRDDLIAQGCEVGWLDPLVEEWDGLTPVSADWECDAAVVATAQPGMPVAAIAGRGVPILDCTGSFAHLANVTRL